MLNFVSAEDFNDTQDVIEDTNNHQNVQASPETSVVKKSDTISSNTKETEESSGENDGEGCCTTIIQGYNNDSAISFRRDTNNKVTINVKNNTSYVKQYKTDSYFFHVIINKDGWLVGNGGEGGDEVNKAIETYALSMINNNQISTTTMNKIYNIKVKFSLGHFVIKSPNGTYSLMIKKTKTYNESGVLKAGQYLVVPNNQYILRKDHSIIIWMKKL